MMFIHPPLAIAGYFFVFLFSVFLSLARNKENRIVRALVFAAWLLTFSGLISGMIWAQIAFGNYWSWDPKETSTLLLLLSVSFSLVFLSEKRLRLAKWTAMLSCVLTIITISVSFIVQGFHSFI